ncbi:serine/threonine-protein kinase [Nannocystis sp. ILAH1]|uniref:serine/threonine-protein kinase n=1 Tax=Nannocystis sp. ILAH1 TaxID=2996789 RepID=UPI00226DDE5B|nr:serine/threonine-protein kinase [Nannocystis sp. ILAH1]MCY0992104.1 serine/threonine-protein kinase [Nannocystis sp. ILAH1]
MTAVASPDSLLGTVLEGRYQLLSVLGRGGMGSVYVAEDVHLRRRCALKVLHPHFAEERANVERFLREAQMMARLEHVNIVDIYSFGEDPSGLVYFAMELLQGEDLYTRLKASGERPYLVHEACLWALQLARAVGCVHEAGLIHRDLKTPNIFLARKRDGEEVVKLLDFGIARPEEGSELTKTGMLLGTPTYMSPEQIQNAAIDRRSDIYSFGVLLFRLITGRFPFHGEIVQLAMAHCQAAPPRPSEVAPDVGISPALEAIVLRALEKQPADRFQSMLEIEAALTALLHDEAPELMPVSRAIRSSAEAPSVPAATSMSAAISGSRAAASAGPVAASMPAASASPIAASTAGASSVPAAASMSGTSSASAAPRAADRDDTTDPTRVFSTGPSAVREPASSRSPLWIAIGAMVIAGIAAFSLLGGDPAPPGVPDAPTVEVAAAPATVASPAAAPAPEAVAEPVPEPEPKPVAEPESVAVSGSPIDPSPPEPAPKLESARPSVKPKEPNATKSPAPLDPLKQIERKALACRRTHKAVGGPLITIDYAIGADGTVTRSIPSSADPLGKCLAEAVQKTRFEPKLVFGRKMQL